jgi:hypothetical protein
VQPRRVCRVERGGVGRDLPALRNRGKRRGRCVEKGQDLRGGLCGRPAGNPQPFDLSSRASALLKILESSPNGRGFPPPLTGLASGPASLTSFGARCPLLNSGRDGGGDVGRAAERHDRRAQARQRGQDRGERGVRSCVVEPDRPASQRARCRGGDQPGVRGSALGDAGCGPQERARVDPGRRECDGGDGRGLPVIRA